MEQIKLRALTLSDLPQTLAWHNQEDISDLYSGHPFPVNKEMEQRWYEKILMSNFPTTVFGIELINTRELVGISILKNIDMIHRKAEFAIYLGSKDARGKGLGYEATYKTLQFAFNKLGLNRVYLKVLRDNIDAMKLYKRIGFAQEGILRKSVFKNNTFKDEHFLGLLKDDFNE